jgi:hypothetical protein
LILNYPSVGTHLCFPFPSRGNQDWTLVSNSVKPGGNFVVLDLSPATWYNLRVTAHNNAGSTVAEYEFATLTLTGGKYKQTLTEPFYFKWILSRRCCEWLSSGVVFSLKKREGFAV